jgi:translation initiation factor 1
MNTRPRPSTGLVYSTDSGRMCPDCRQPVAQCICKAQASAVPRGDGGVRVVRETQGRGGKAVTVVRGLGLEPGPLAALGKRLRAACGAGGTAKDGVLEIQGDRCEQVIDLLRQDGRTVKRAGG